MIKPPELLCPAGDEECLSAAIDFGADAVYLGGTRFGMRAHAGNFGKEALPAAVMRAHEAGVSVYITCNTLPHEEDISLLPEFLEEVEAARADALIVSDMGTLALAAKHAPKTALHISVQAGVTNSESAKAFASLGAKRVVLARELSLFEIAKIRENTPSGLELEAFVHGAVCMSVSSRCLLSSYLTGRDANRGDCAQPCRYRYSLMEEKRPGRYFDITEDERGSFILNSEDLCMIRRLKELADAGISCFKIEGRAKSAYYTAVTAAAYRAALDVLARGEDFPEWAESELGKISHRPYSTGFYFGTPSQETKNGGYIRKSVVAAVVTGYENGNIILSERNRFAKGQVFDCLPPHAPPFKLKADRLLDKDGNDIDSAFRAAETVLIPSETPLPAGTFLRISEE